MAEPNGSGRLNRIEALLDKMADRLDKVATMGYLHDEVLSRLEANAEALDIKVDKLVESQKRQGEALDKRAGDLVGAIRDLIDRIPPESLRRPA